MRKKNALIGFLVILLIVIPLTIFLLQKQTKIAQRAAPSTNLSLSTTQQQITVGQIFQVNVNIDPGSNQISFVKLNILYDKTKIATVSPGITSNQSLNLITLNGPTYSNCSGNTCYISVAYGIGNTKSNAISSADTIATISFKALTSTTDTGSTTIGFGNNNQAYSLAPTDQPTQNAIVNTQPLQITIGDIPTSTPGSATDTPIPSGSPTNTSAPNAPTNTPAPGNNPGNTSAPASNPVICNSLTADNNSTTSAPFTINFTVLGSDSASTISKASLNFGDGANQDITSGGGIGTANINAQISHVYQTNGQYNASAILTDLNGNTSNSSSCNQAVNIGPTNPPPTNANQTSPTNSSVLLKTGPGNNILTIGGLGILGTIIGGLVFIGL